MESFRFVSFQFGFHWEWSPKTFCLFVAETSAEVYFVYPLMNGTASYFQVPEGSSVHEDGSIVAADGTVLAPPGSVIVGEDGTLMMTQDGAMLMQGDAGGVCESMENQAYHHMGQDDAAEMHQPSEGVGHSDPTAGEGGGAEDDTGGGEGSAATVTEGETEPYENMQQHVADAQHAELATEQAHIGVPVSAVEDSESGHIYAPSLGQIGTLDGQVGLSQAADSQTANRGNDDGQLEGEAAESSDTPVLAHASESQLSSLEEPAPAVIDTAPEAGDGSDDQVDMKATTVADAPVPDGCEVEQGEANSLAAYTTTEGTIGQQPYARQAIYTTADGTVVSAPEGTLMANADGNLVTADGTVLTTEDGTPVSLHGSILSHSEGGK